MLRRRALRIGAKEERNEGERKSIQAVVKDKKILVAEQLVPSHRFCMEDHLVELLRERAGDGVHYALQSRKPFLLQGMDSFIGGLIVDVAQSGDFSDAKGLFLVPYQ